MSLPARGSLEASPGHCTYDLACAGATAASLIELALSESQRPVTELGEALSRVSAAVATGAAPATRDLETCVECLQFHDRMVQQLSQVRDLLAAVAATGSADATPGGRTSWPVILLCAHGMPRSNPRRLLLQQHAPHDRR